MYKAKFVTKVFAMFLFQKLYLYYTEMLNKENMLHKRMHKLYAIEGIFQFEGNILMKSNAHTIFLSSQHNLKTSNFGLDINKLFV